MSNDAKQDLFERLKTMDKGELLLYESAAKNTSRGIAIIAVSILLFTMYFPTILAMIVGSIAVILLATAGVGVDDAIKEIRRLIATKQ